MMFNGHTNSSLINTVSIASSDAAFHCESDPLLSPEAAEGQMLFQCDSSPENTPFPKGRGAVREGFPKRHERPDAYRPVRRHRIHPENGLALDVPLGRDR